ncbi:MAG: hypothetical protein RTV31_16040 [Candidatus Thorarchaeota archaeon]
MIIEIDVLGRGQTYSPPSEVFPHILKIIAEIRKTTPEEIEALNHKNVHRLIMNDSKLKGMADLLHR